MVEKRLLFTELQREELDDFLPKLRVAYNLSTDEEVTFSGLMQKRKYEYIISDLFSSYSGEYDHAPPKVFPSAMVAQSILLEISISPLVPVFILKLMLDTWRDTYLTNADWLQWQMPQLLTNPQLTGKELQDIYESLLALYPVEKSPLYFLVNKILDNANCPISIFRIELDKIIALGNEGAMLNDMWIKILNRPDTSPEMFMEAREYLLTSEYFLKSALFSTAVHNENCPAIFLSGIEELIDMLKPRDMWIAEAATAPNCPVDVSLRLLDTIPFVYTAASQKRLEGKIDNFLRTLDFDEEFLRDTPYDLKCKLVITGQESN